MSCRNALTNSPNAPFGRWGLLLVNVEMYGMRSNIVLGNAPTIYTPQQLEAIKTADRVFIFNDARNLHQIKRSKPIVLVFANTYHHLWRMDRNGYPWNCAIQAATEIWCTYEDNYGNLIRVLMDRFDCHRPITKVFAVEPAMPSSGNMVFKHLLEDPQNKIHYCGFTFEGYEGHPWAAEKEWTLSQPRLRPLEN